jgi:hypothetical protein
MGTKQSSNVQKYNNEAYFPEHSIIPNAQRKIYKMYENYPPIVKNIIMSYYGNLYMYTGVLANPPYVYTENELRVLLYNTRYYGKTTLNLRTCCIKKIVRYCGCLTIK